MIEDLHDLLVRVGILLILLVGVLTPDGRLAYARIYLDPHDPVAKRDLTLMLIALLRLRDYGTPAARRRAYGRIPKQWSRAIHREMTGLIADIKLLRPAC